LPLEKALEELESVRCASILSGALYEIVCFKYEKNLYEGPRWLEQKLANRVKLWKNTCDEAFLKACELDRLARKHPLSSPVVFSLIKQELIK